jgi:hypothetical protein
MTDTYGDGICCQYGAFEFKIILNDEPGAISSSAESQDIVREIFDVVGRSTGPTVDYRLAPGSPHFSTLQISRTRLRTRKTTISRSSSRWSLSLRCPRQVSRARYPTKWIHSCAPYIRLLCIFDKVNDRSVAKHKDLTSEDPRSKVLRYEILLPYIFRC